MKSRAIALFLLQVLTVLDAQSSGDLPEQWLKYDVLPGRPNLKQAQGQAAISDDAFMWSSMEATALERQASIAADSEAASQAKLSASQNELKLASAARGMATSASRVKALRRRAQQVSLDTRHLLDSIPEKANLAINRAIDDAVNAAISRMNVEVANEVQANQADRGMINNAAIRYAADKAQAAALPMQKAKLRKVQEVYGFVSQEQSLGVVVQELKRNADLMASEAIGLQRQGEIWGANKLHSQAEDLLKVAAKVVDKANFFHASADRVRQQLSGDDAAGTAAASYAAHQASLNATKIAELQPPPAPLTFPANVL